MSKLLKAIDQKLEFFLDRFVDILTSDKSRWHARFSVVWRTLACFGIMGLAVLAGGQGWAFIVLMVLAPIAALMSVLTLRVFKKTKSPGEEL